MIQIKPKTVECQNYWQSKIEGVIFVEKEYVASQLERCEQFLSAVEPMISSLHTGI